MFTEEARCRAKLKKAIKLLRDAKGAINDQLYAAGPDEVKQHPILRSHDRLTTKIEKFLGEVGI